MLLNTGFIGLTPLRYAIFFYEVIEIDSGGLELEKRVSKKFSGTDDEPAGKLGAAIAKIAIAATISTIREYERMKAQKQSD